MKPLHLDTHVAIWIHDRRPQRIAPKVSRRIERAGAVISPIVRLELHVLHETGRLKIEPDDLVESLKRDVALVESRATLSDVVQRAVGFAWTRDPFDRLIVANAMADGCDLVTADQHVLAHFAGAVW